MERGTHSVCATVFSCNGKQNIDTDLVLPDYCGDIKRILHCEVQPGLRTVNGNGERLAAEGDVQIRLLYLNEDDEADSLEQTLPLSISCRCAECPAETVIRAQAAKEYINCRAVSPRKVQLDGTITVRFDGYMKQEVSYVRALEQCETSMRSVSCSALSAVAAKTIDLSETIALSESEPPIGSILMVTGAPLLRSTEAADDKLLLKGELQLDLVVLSEDKEIRSVRHSLPINQVIEAEGMRQNDNRDVSLTLRAVSAQPKRDASDAARLLDLAAKVEVFVRAYRDETMQIITDCYAVNGNLTTTFEPEIFLRLLPGQQFQTAAQQSWDTGFKDAKLLYAGAGSVQTEPSFSDGQIRMVHHVMICALLQDKDREIHYKEETVDVEQNLPLGAESGDAVFTPQTTVVLDSINLSQTGVMQIGLSVQVNGSVFIQQKEQMLRDAVMDKSPESVQAKMILSFCGKGEDLWSIGKRYRAPAAEIKEENKLTEDKLSEEKMLIIISAS